MNNTEATIPHTIIIAEAGVNHNGSVETALKMITAAAEAGVDFIKFQTYKAENLVAANAPKAAYQQANCGNSESQLDMLKKLELTENDFITLSQECKKSGIGFMSTPFDLQSIDFLASFHMPYWKIPSGEITNLPYLRHMAKYGGKAIISTGMSTPDEISDALEVLSTNGICRKNIYILHCNTQYPTPFQDVNLRAMDALKDFECAGVGYSDHTQGIIVPVAAVARGAKIIEKHFTLDRTMEGPDHKASLVPEELKAMVTAIRQTELSLGSSSKAVTESERQNKVVARKSIVAARNILKGEILDEFNLTTKRPAIGISPMKWDSVIGTIAIHDFKKDDIIEI